MYPAPVDARHLTPPEAIALGRGIEKYTPMFFEDPLRPNSFDAMAEVARISTSRSPQANASPACHLCKKSDEA
jgi:L-alanine-DL-glutamate epimerase-like enolase superfamily enzyme